jgi:homoserine dehydrogenase
VLNGTTNAVLTSMQDGVLGYEEALARAVAAGIAEPDPRLDVEATDSAAKILILSQLLMKGSSSLEEVARIGIGPAVEPLAEHARRTGGRVRLVARARTWQGRLRLSVAPKVVPPDSPFHDVDGTAKAAIFRTAAGEILARARSGRDAIAAVILQDILEIARFRGET